MTISDISDHSFVPTPGFVNFPECMEEVTIEMLDECVQDPCFIYEKADIIARYMLAKNVSDEIINLFRVNEVQAHLMRKAECEAPPHVIVEVVNGYIRSFQRFNESKLMAMCQYLAMEKTCRAKEHCANCPYHETMVINKIDSSNPIDPEKVLEVL